MNYSDARISPNNFADVMGVSRSTVRSWVDSGKYVMEDGGDGRDPFFRMDDLRGVPEISQMLSGNGRRSCRPSHQGHTLPLNFSLGLEAWPWVWRWLVFNMYF